MRYSNLNNRMIKKLMTIFVAFLITSLVFTSCGPSSVKGDWTESDMNACISDMNREMQQEDEVVKAGLELFGVSLDGFSECRCERFENKYDSYSSADADEENMTEEETALFLMSCFGEDFMNLINSALDSLDFIE